MGYSTRGRWEWASEDMVHGQCQLGLSSVEVDWTPTRNINWLKELELLNKLSPVDKLIELNDGRRNDDQLTEYSGRRISSSKLGELVSASTSQQGPGIIDGGSENIAWVR